jgi:hypothetical protein
MMKIALVFFFLSVNLINAQGIYAPAVGQLGTTAVHKDSSIIVSWATSCLVTRGYQQIDSTQLGLVSAGSVLSATGIADGQIVSLGDSGIAILEFLNPIYNGQGNDFVVFENAFNSTFLELAFVEVSSDGANFFRFNNYSTTPDTSQMGNFAVLDPSHIHNLAGKYEVMYGTPFNLDDVTDNLLLDKSKITHIKLIDVIGSVSSLTASYDSDNNVVNDPWPTPYPSSGFDLDAVGVINESNAASISTTELVFSIYPNPISDVINIAIDNNDFEASIYSISGNLMFSTTNKIINVSELNSGVYLLKVKTNKKIGVKRIIKK